MHVWKFVCTCIWLHIQHKADWYTCLYSKYLHAPVFDQLPIISVGHEFESGNKKFILGWDWVELEYNVNYSIMESSMLLTPLYPNLENTIKSLSILIVKMLRCRLKSPFKRLGVVEMSRNVKGLINALTTSTLPTLILKKTTEKRNF